MCAAQTFAAWEMLQCDVRGSYPIPVLVGGLPPCAAPEVARRGNNDTLGPGAKLLLSAKHVRNRPARKECRSDACSSVALPNPLL